MSDPKSNQTRVLIDHYGAEYLTSLSRATRTIGIIRNHAPYASAKTLKTLYETLRTDLQSGQHCLDEIATLIANLGWTP